MEFEYLKNIIVLEKIAGKVSFMLGRRKKPVSEGKIEKPEDKAWEEWFNKLDTKEHEKYLKQLGLDDEEIQEWGKGETQKPSITQNKKKQLK